MTLLADVNWKHGLKTAIAAGVCLALVRVFGFQQGYWACVATIVVMQSETAATLTASRDRLVGTTVGALIGWAAATLWHGHLLVYAIAVLICMVVPEVMGLKGAGRLAGVTATIILLVPSSYFAGAEHGSALDGSARPVFRSEFRNCGGTDCFADFVAEDDFKGRSGHVTDMDSK